jgi:polysaccharide biosynthesis transport protein
MKRSIVPAATPARAYWLFALGFGLIGAILALAASLIAPPKYEAHAKLYVSTVGGAPVSNASYQETTASQQIALSLAKLVPSEVITARVVDSLQLDMSPSELASQIEATVEPETVLIDLNVTNSSPTVAREVANATAFEFTDFVEELQVKAAPSMPKPQVTLIQPAVTPSAPISPNVPRNVGLGTLAGLVAGLVFATLRERANRTVRDVHSLQHIVGQPPLGSIPISRSRDGESVAVVIDDKSVLEGFKEVRTNLRHALGVRPTRIVCVTSAGLSEGKTTTVLGIAIALADAGHRVVVVDSDLRRPDLSRRLKLTGTAGLTEAISDRFTVGDVIHPSGLPGIDAISSGHASDQPSELLSSDRAALLFCILGERYDFVLLDTPPLLAFTDAAVIADHADGVVLVVPYAHVESNDLEAAVASLHRVERRILGPVFTFAPVSESRRRSLEPRRSRMKSQMRHPGWLSVSDDVEDDVEQHGSDSSRGDAQVEDDLEPRGEPVVEVAHGNRNKAKESTAERAEESTAEQAEEITAEQAEEITAEQAERESHVNYAGTEQSHDRDTDTSMDDKAEPDSSWPLLVDKWEFGVNGASDNHALGRHARSQ